MTERSVPKALHKAILRLHERRGRQKLGLVLLEGEKIVRLAHELGLDIQSILAEAERPDLAATYPAAYVTPRAQLAELATTATPPPMLAVARRPESVIELSPSVLACGVLALDGVQDPGNVGALLRTAQAFGVGGAVLGRGVVDRWSPKVVRGSMGAALSLPIVETDDLAEWLTRAGEHGTRIYLAEAAGGVDPGAIPPTQAPWCLVLGSEAHGISPSVGAVPGATSITLRIQGVVGSLGVAAAGAVLLNLLHPGQHAH